MNLIRFVPKSQIKNVPKCDTPAVPTSSFMLPNEVLNELRCVRLSSLTRADGTFQFPRTSGIEVSDPLSTSILHLLENGEGSDFNPDEAAD